MSNIIPFPEKTKEKALDKVVKLSAELDAATLAWAASHGFVVEPAGIHTEYGERHITYVIACDGKLIAGPDAALMLSEIDGVIRDLIISSRDEWEHIVHYHANVLRPELRAEYENSPEFYQDFPGEGA